MASLLTRVIRALGGTVEDVTVAVLPSEVGDIVLGCGRAELHWCRESASWSLIRTEVLGVSSRAYVQRGPEGEQ